MSFIGIALNIWIDTYGTGGTGGGTTPSITTGILLENGTDFVLTEDGDFVLQE